jgi:hypothetical protein
LYEQELLRCFNRLSCDELNQSVSFSFCTIIKDDEVYSEYKQQQAQAAGNATSPTNSDATATNNSDGANRDENKTASVAQPPTSKEKFLISINEIKVKFDKFKVSA